MNGGNCKASGSWEERLEEYKRQLKGNIPKINGQIAKSECFESSIEICYPEFLDEFYEKRIKSRHRELLELNTKLSNLISEYDKALDQFKKTKKIVDIVLFSLFTFSLIALMTSFY